MRDTRCAPEAGPPGLRARPASARPQRLGPRRPASARKLTPAPPPPDTPPNSPPTTHSTVSGNNISGAVPGSLNSLPLLTSLDLSQNSLSGGIPFLPNLRQLTYFDASLNQLAGAHPRPASAPPRAAPWAWVWVRGGAPPACVSDTDRAAASRLVPVRPQTAGTIPWTFGALKKLQTLRITDNKLTGCALRSAAQPSQRCPPQHPPQAPGVFNPHGASLAPGGRLRRYIPNSIAGATALQARRPMIPP